MKNKFQQLERLQRICAKLGSFKGIKIPKKELSQMLEVSERTINIDFALLKDVYDAPIAFDIKSKGFYFKEPYDFPAHLALKPQDITALKLAVATLQQYKQLGMFDELAGLLDKIETAVYFKTKTEKLQYDFIQFESVPYFAGSEQLEFFVQAIQDKKTISFQYQKFQDEQASQRNLHPYFLKEHRNRWYVIGRDEKDNAIKSFGLDRITQPQVSSIQYKENHTDLAKLLKNSFGIFINFGEKPETIILSFTPLRAKYLKTQPFHAQQLDSRRILIDDTQEFRVQFDLLINEELVMELARLGSDVKVISPQTLKDKLSKYHQKALLSQ